MTGATRPFRRGAEGAIYGLALAAFEFATWRAFHGYPLGSESALPLAVLGAAIVGIAWGVAETAIGILPSRWRPDRRGFAFAAVTTLAVLAAIRLRDGGRGLGDVGFWVELAVGVGLLLALTARERRGGASTGWRSVALGTAIGIAFGTGALHGAPPGPVVARSDPPLGAPNVVVVLIDTLRVDRLTTHGASRDTMPTLERLTDEGFLYRRAYTPSSWTSPSVASMFTGLSASSHGLTEWHRPLGRVETTIAEHVRAHGFRTFASVGNRVVGASYGFARGFERFLDPPGTVLDRSIVGIGLTHALRFLGDEVLNVTFLAIHEALLPEGVGSFERATRRIAADLDAWLAETGDAPFFAYLHLMEPHDPYEPSVANLGRFGETGDARLWAPQAMWSVAPRRPAHRPAWVGKYLDRYDEELRTTDDGLAEVVASLRAQGVFERTWILVVSDHGEEFLDRGGWLHGFHTHEEIVRGLLVVRAPRGDLRGTSDRPVSLRELPDTITRIAGLPPLPGAQSSTWTELLGEPPTPAAPVLVEQYPLAPGYRHSFALVDGTWKLLRHESEVRGTYREQLFDLERDPGERDDVAGSHPEIVARLSATLRERITETEAVDPTTLGHEATAPLRALGYLQ